MARTEVPLTQQQVKVRLMLVATMTLTEALPEQTVTMVTRTVLAGLVATRLMMRAPLARR